MALYFTNFSGYSTGVAPYDWVEEWNTGVASLDIVTSPAEIGGKSLLIDHSSNERYATTWSEVGIVTDCEILAKVRATTSGLSVISVNVRVGGNSSSQEGYDIRLDTSTNEVRLFEYPSNTEHDNYSMTLDPHIWYWIRFRAQGPSLKGRAWQDGYEEPVIWHVESADGTHVSGGVGLGSYRADAYCDYFAVETSSGSWPIKAFGYCFSGYVYQEETPVSRTVRLYRRDTGMLIDYTTSSGDGYYYLSTAYSGSHYIVALDDAAGTQYNLATLDWMIPATVS